MKTAEFYDVDIYADDQTPPLQQYTICFFDGRTAQWFHCYKN